MKATPLNPPLPLGTETQWGKVIAISNWDDNRHYMLRDKEGKCAFLPAYLVECSQLPCGG